MQFFPEEKQISSFISYLSDPFSNLRRESDKFTTIDLPFRHSSAAFILLLSNRNKTALLLVLTSFRWTIIRSKSVRSSERDDYLRRSKQHLYRVSFQSMSIKIPSFYNVLPKLILTFFSAAKNSTN